MKEEIKENTLTNSFEKRVGSSLINFLIVIAKHKMFLTLFVFSITVGVTGIALLSTKWYKATASVLPAEKTDLFSSLGGISSLVKSFSPTKGLASLTANTELDRYMAILKSAKLTDDVIRKFNLRDEYELTDDYYEKVVKTFLANQEITVTDEGNLAINVFDKSPQKAADIANYMIQRLNEINTELSVTNAKSNRKFIEKRYLENVNTIEGLRNRLKLFQEKYGVIAVPEQMEATIKSMANIYADLTKSEVSANVLKRLYGSTSPLVHQAEVEQQEISKKLNNINSGKDWNKDNLSALIPIKKAPMLVNQYMTIYSDLQIQYKILEFVQPMFEQAKVEEIRNTPSVLVLDYATPPDRKAKPRGSIYFLISFLGSILSGLMIVFSIEAVQRIKLLTPDQYNNLVVLLKFNNKKIQIK